LAIYFPYEVRCGCGTVSVASLPDSVNVERTPAVREAILSGAFNRFECAACKRNVTVEKSFFYIDPQCGDYFSVKPRQDRHMWRAVSDQLARASKRLAIESLTSAPRLRVIFGMAELREKLVAEDLGLDDAALELLKVGVIHEHPFLIQRPRLRLTLSAGCERDLTFRAAFDLDEARFKISVARAPVMPLLSSAPKLATWLGQAQHRSKITELADDYWVNHWRWSPQPHALEALQALAAETSQGKPLDPADPRLARVVTYAPRGELLPGWAKKALTTLSAAARQQGHAAVEGALFEIRFNKQLSNDWETNADDTDIDSLWRLLQSLPAGHVEGNVAIDAINYTEGPEALSFYDPSAKDIYIDGGLLPNREQFEDVVRHEIGHGVYSQDPARQIRIDDWLKSAFGWVSLPLNSANLDAWVALMGGWAQWGVAPGERAGILACMAVATGPGNVFVSGPEPAAMDTDQWWKPGLGPRQAYLKSGDYWYENHDNWFRVRHDGVERAFFVNFYYRHLSVVNTATLDIIKNIRADYAAMSPVEFFAELYALYYDGDDALRTALPAEVTDWLKTNIGAPYQPPAE
jgi:hypothetical protein